MPGQFVFNFFTAMISGPSSYIPTLDEFLAHWAAVNADPAVGTGLVTRDGTTRAALVTLRGTLATAAQQVQSALNLKEIKRAQVENAKRNALARTQELGRRMRGTLPQDSPYLQAVPELPSQSAGQETFLMPVRDMLDLWTRMDGDGISFTLSGTYSLDDYSDAYAALALLYTALNTALMDLKLAREKRNFQQTRAREILSAYRPAVEGLFPPDSPLVLTIPLIYPPGGRTPAPVTATGSYDLPTAEAVISYSQSADPELKEYQVRGVPGPEYIGEDEVVLATLLPGAPRSFRTDYSLGQPGTAASFKVYVILTTGNEAGSNAVTVTHP